MCTYQRDDPGYGKRLSLQGGGNAYDDFFWASEVFKSWDNVNIGQTIVDRCIDRSLVGLGPSGGMNIVTTGVDRYQENQWEEEGLMPGDAILTGDTNNYTDYIFLHVEDGETKVRVEWTLNKQYETFIATIGHARIGACAVDGHEDEFKYEVWVNDGVDEVQRLKGGRLGSEGDQTWKPYYNQITIDVRDQETLIIVIENNDDSQIHPPTGPNCDHAVLANPRLICECKDRYLTGYGTSAQFGFDSVDDPNTGIAYSENQWRGGNTITMQNGVTYDEMNGGFIAMYPTGTLGGSPTYAEWDVNGLYKTFSAIIGPGHNGAPEDTAANSMIFMVYGDGNLLYESASLSAANDDYDDLTIDITGVNILRIETDEVTDNTDDWAMIAAPMLTNCGMIFSVNIIDPTIDPTSDPTNPTHYPTTGPTDCSDCCQFCSSEPRSSSGSSGSGSRSSERRSNLTSRLITSSKSRSNERSENY